MSKATKKPLKDVLSEIADSVSHLPENLQQAAFTVLLNRSLDTSQAEVPTTPKQVVPNASGKTPLTHSDSFGDYFASFPSDLSEDQKTLVAASFAETQAEDRTYTVKSLHDLLKGIGVKLTNSGLYAKRLVKPKGWAIIVGKATKRNFKYRVSKNGNDELKRLKDTNK